MADKWVQLAKSNIAIPTSATTLTVIATVNVPAGAMGPNGIIRIESVWSQSGAIGARTVNAKFGGVNVMNASLLVSNFGFRGLHTVMNRNSQASQVAGNLGGTPFGQTVSGTVTTAINTALATTITFSGSASGGTPDVCTLEAYLVELLFGA